MKQRKDVKKEGEIIKPETLTPKVIPGEELEVLGYIKQGLTKEDIRAIYTSWRPKKFETLWKNAIGIMKQAVAEQEEAKAEAVMLYKDLYFKAQRVGNIKECRNILDSLCKVQGLGKEGINIATEFVTVWK